MDKGREGQSMDLQTNIKGREDRWIDRWGWKYGHIMESKVDGQFDSATKDRLRNGKMEIDREEI